ncbi:MAG: dATP/dGTP diphosphohydrolase domain-containing protein [Luteolibacter sp.]
MNESKTYDLPNSGSQQKFATGSVRDSQEGRGRFDLLPAFAISEVAKHFEAGARAYAERNWEKGQPTSRYLNSALRHIFKHLDNQTDEPHLSAAAWNILCAIETAERVRRGLLPAELADLPNPHLCREDTQACYPRGKDALNFDLDTIDNLMRSGARP